jgi:predicted transcriptional regulator
VKKRNKYLVEYEGIYRLKRSADKLSLSTQDSVSKKSELQKQLDSLTQDFNKISDNDQKVKIQQQIEKTRNYLKDISQKIIDDKKELGLFDKNYQTKIKNFESQMKIEEQKIKNMT